MKRFLSVLFIAVMAMSMIPFAQAEDAPLIRIAVSQNNNQGDIEDIWFWEYCKQVLGYNFEIEQIANAAEYKQLTFASGDLPDILMNLNLSTQELMSYGEGEGMLLALDEYFTEASMPNLYAMYKRVPEYFDLIRATDGHIYSVGQFCETVDEAKIVGAGSRVYYNNRWLSEIGGELPSTVDEFVALLRKVKEAKPESVPFAGGWSVSNPCSILLNAYGFVTDNPKALSPALLNGEVVFPYACEKEWTAYITTMNTLYNEGLIDNNFFTLDATALGAQISSDTTFMNNTTPYTYNAGTFEEWLMVMPLISKYNGTPFVRNAENSVTTGVFAISAASKHIDECVKFLDWWFDERNCMMACFGPNENETELQLGKTCGWYYDEETTLWGYKDVDPNGKYNSSGKYRTMCVSPLTSVALGAISAGARFQLWGAAMYLGLPYNRENLNFNPAEPDHFMRLEYRKLLDYVVSGYPAKIFFTYDENVAVTDIQIVLDSYVEAETAKFITNARPLAELPEFFEELNRLGYEEYVGYYKAYYEKNVKTAG